MIITTEDKPESEMNLFTNFQTGTYKDVQHNPELSDEQKVERGDRNIGINSRRFLRCS